MPAVLELPVEEQRCSKAIEVTAWFVVCEAVANAMKHAAKSGVSVAVEEVGGSVIVRVRDDGPGIADPLAVVCEVYSTAPRLWVAGCTCTAPSTAPKYERSCHACRDCR